MGGPTLNLKSNAFILSNYESIVDDERVEKCTYLLVFHVIQVINIVSYCTFKWYTQYIFYLLLLHILFSYFVHIIFIRLWNGQF